MIKTTKQGRMWVEHLEAASKIVSKWPIWKQGFVAESNNPTNLVSRTNEKLEELVVCPVCDGDGKETCDNPDHGLIADWTGETGRLGCPVCGHDPNHKVPNGGVCEACGGTGTVSEVCKALLEEHYGI